MITMNQRNISLQLTFYALVLLLVYTNAGTKCIERERQALLLFKQGLSGEMSSLYSWGSEDCCKWSGVHCSNRTGHIVTLDLDSYFLRGSISSSLVVLQHLSYLDLSDNDFGGNQIPEFIGNLTNLRFLDLSNANFTVSRLEWLSRLRKLRQLRLESIDHWEATDWVQVISGLPSLKDLDLSSSTLPTINHQSLSVINSSTSLTHLDLTFCGLSNSAYHWLSNISESLVDLDLSVNQLQGSIPDYAFGNMISLVQLDLSDNRISGISKSSFPVNLVHLYLHSNELQGPIPDYAFRNLTSLDDLYLMNNNFTGISKCPLPINLLTLDLFQNELQGPISNYAFCNMTSLVHLDFTSNQITGISRSFGDMCSLKTLVMTFNNLNGRLPDLFFNLSGCAKKSLEILNLEHNMLVGSLPDITVFSSLKELHIYNNSLDGSFPREFKQPSPLVELDLHANQLWGPLPDLSIFPFLGILDISYNRLNGTVSQGLGQLSQLVELNLYSNSLECMITEAHLSNLTQLKFLDFSYNSMALNFSPDWIPPFQLDNIRFRSCKLGPHFPKWLRSQKNYIELDISNGGIIDIVPNWFWDDISPNLYSLNLSYNQMKGKLPNLSLKFDLCPGIDLSSNCFEGSIPLFPPSVVSLILSKNMFSGSISFLCAITGEDLTYLDLSDNQLIGEIPNCSRYWQNLNLLNLANNNFSGRIPHWMDSSCQIRSLHLRQNSLSGELPSSLKNCKELVVIDLGNNKISGTIPAWLGDSLLNLAILSLRSNHIYGNVPPQLCYLSKVQVLDFSQNNISGTLPLCLNNLTAMVQKEISNAITFSITVSQTGPKGVAVDFQDQALLVWKGVDSEYKNTLGLVKSIDLSSNKLSGKIPKEITSLVRLLSLNLSRNNLTGSIPPEIGQFTLLNSLDLSQNQLTGKIPESTSQLNHLGVLNLSSNNLSGKIPSSTHLQTFDASSFMGNPMLCGSPLPNKCPGEEPTAPKDPTIIVHDSEDDGFITRGFYISAALGFIIAFWGFCGTLLLNRNRRHAFFQLLDDVKDKLYVFIAVNMANLKRWL